MPCRHQCCLLVFGPPLTETARNIGPFCLRNITSDRHGQPRIKQQFHSIDIAANWCPCNGIHRATSAEALASDSGISICLGASTRPRLRYNTRRLCTLGRLGLRNSRLPHKVRCDGSGLRCRLTRLLSTYCGPGWSWSRSMWSRSAYQSSRHCTVYSIGQYNDHTTVTAA
jgi:hypothetical protein